MGERNKSQLGELKSEAKAVPKELRPVLRYLILTTLSLCQESRVAMGILLDVWVIPTAASLHQKLRETGRVYARKAEELGRNHTLGPPHVWMFGALLNYLKECTDVRTQTRKALTEIAQAYETWDTALTCQIVRMVRITKCFKSESKKLWISLGEVGMQVESKMSHSLRLTLIRAMGDIPNHRRTQGKAPAGYTEQQLSEFLGRLSEAASG